MNDVVRNDLIPLHKYILTFHSNLLKSSKHLYKCFRDGQCIYIYKLMLNIISKMISKTFLPNSFKLGKKFSFYQWKYLVCQYRKPKI